MVADRRAIKTSTATGRATNERGLMNWDLRSGAWEDTLSAVDEVDAIVTDPPYSARTHAGHDDGAALANRAGRGWTRQDGAVDAFRARRAISYAAWSPREVEAFVGAWAPRCRGWFVAFSDSELCSAWRAAFEANGLTGFHPLPLVIRGMTVRMSGDGPSSWAVYLNVARPKSLHKWGTLPGAYEAGQGEREHVGGKPLSAMRRIILDYTRAGDLVCDPCAGMGTTLLAALMEGRHAIGAEVDAATAAHAAARIARDYRPDLFSATEARRTCAQCRGTFRLDAFAIDRSHPTGRQSWCRRCKAEWECGPEGSWLRMRAELQPREPGSFALPRGWTRERYLREWEKCGAECVLCGAGLREWQASGHNLDRIDNTQPHVPGNCRMLCWPCNKKKSSTMALAADEEIRGWVARYGRGKVPWGELTRGQFRRFELPDVEPFRIVESDDQIALPFAADGG